MTTLFGREQKQPAPDAGKTAVMWGFCAAIWLALAFGNWHDHQHGSRAGMQAVASALCGFNALIHFFRWRRERKNA